MVQLLRRVVLVLIVGIGWAIPVSAQTFRAASEASDVTFTSSALLISAPTGTTLNDLVILQAISSCLNACTAPTISQSAGFTEIRTDVLTNLGAGVYDSRVYYYWKVAGASETTWSLTCSAACGWYVSAFSYYNTATSSPYQVSDFSTVTATTSFVAPSVTTTQANSLVFVIYLTDTTGTTFSTPTGMTARTTANAFDVVQAVAGASGTKTSTASASGTGGAWTLSFSPAGSGGRMLLGIGR